MRMKTPIYVRPLTDVERKQLEAGLRSPDSFTLRRCQILLASARRQKANQIAVLVGCSDQTVRDVIKDFEQRGLSCLRRRPFHPNSSQSVLDPETTEKIKELLHKSPRAFGKAGSLWTLNWVADVAHAQGLTPRRVSAECIRQGLLRAGVRWKRAKHWITSPDPQYVLKKNVVRDCSH